MAGSPNLSAGLPDVSSDLSPHGVITTDADLVVRGWNSWLARSSGRRVGEVIGRSLLDLYPELAARGLDQAYRQAIAGQTVVLSQRLHRYLLPIPPADEYATEFERMQQSAQIGPLWQDGTVVGTLTVISDVTERVAREQELQLLLVQERAARAEAERATQRVERLLHITTALASALTLTDIAAVIVGQGGATVGAYAGVIGLLNMDAAALEMVYAEGYPQATVELWHHLPLEIPSPLTQAALTREGVYVAAPTELAARYPLLAAARAEIRSQALVALPLVVYGRVTGVLGLSFETPQAFSAEDRSFLAALAHQGAQGLERARLYEAEQHAREQAESAVLMREQFLSVAAHELRTPLTSMLGNAQLLQRRLLREGGVAERHHRLLGIAIDQGMRLSRMVATMLDVSRLETGRFNLDVRSLDLAQLLRQIVNETQATLVTHTISFQGPDEPVMIDGDELRLEQVFQNLLSNAVKYSPAGGHVAVRLESDAGDATVEVQDQGIGIPAEAQPQLFQQFFRAANAEAHRISGVGIGLYVVREIVTRHGGTITVASEEGQGTTFTVRLPDAP
ncbi:MAG: hypothetical protein RLZZ387_4886 [Chloroflexota bacterium]|jgi:signal transduction histidine kinase